MIRTETKYLPLKARQKLGKQALGRNQVHGQGTESGEYSERGEWSSGESWSQSCSETQAAKRSGCWCLDSCLENSVQGQTGKIKAEPLLRKSWSLDQKVRQRLRMQENRTKTQPLRQRYKIALWSKEWGERLISGNKVRDQDRLAWAKRPWCPTAKLWPGFFFLLSWVGRGPQPGTELSGNKILILRCD